MSPTFGVAFGGGGARGLAHIHIVEALDELGIKPVAIAGSSIGAIMGAGMASGRKALRMRSTLNWPTRMPPCMASAIVPGRERHMRAATSARLPRIDRA